MSNNDNLFHNNRYSKMILGEVYFWTNTIHEWRTLLNQDNYKRTIIDSLKHLVQKKKITIYAFVIMPNHIHLVWKLNEMNGKEQPHASFNKFTAHQIIHDLKDNHPNVLPHFKVNEAERKHRIWQRDALAVLMDSREKVEQKIEYIHLNPLQEHWNLAQYPEEYYWSSAKFYESGVDDFGFLTHYMESF